MTRNLKIFIGLVVAGTAGFLALSDGLAHLSGSALVIASWLMLILFFWIIFNFVYRVIYRLVGVTDKLMFKGRTKGWPRLTHQQAAEVNKYWLVWLSSSLSTYVIYTFLFHREQWKGSLVFGLIVAVIIILAKISSKHKIAGHTKQELFK
ncbi:MAG TPA: hypothetical protein VFW90_00320 [Candidatus Saccharimonadales bacterium]|nr:hypothetical protein [Candidatus Saccharimonadales bacterium]